MKAAGSRLPSTGHGSWTPPRLLFRLRGFGDVTVAEVMKEAGLTHGAFMALSVQRRSSRRRSGKPCPRLPTKPVAPPGGDYADYLSVRHRDNRATSCLFSSLGGSRAWLGRTL